MKREPSLSDYDNDRDAYETARTGFEDYEDTERRRYWEERDEMERARASQFSTKPEALSFLRENHPVSWRCHRGKNKGLTMVASLKNGKVVIAPQFK